MTTLGLIRHGVTDWNLEGRMQGQTDIPLNEEGIRQAMKLARRLADDGMGWDAIYSSDLMRASETARFIAEALNLGEVRRDNRLRERGFGLAEGLTPAERESRFGARLAELAGIETEEKVLERGKAFLDDILAMEANRILVVSHGGFMKRFFTLLVPDLPDVHIGNASLTIMKLIDGKWQVQLHNCMAHYETAIPAAE